MTDINDLKNVADELFEQGAYYAAGLYYRECGMVKKAVECFDLANEYPPSPEPADL